MRLNGTLRTMTRWEIVCAGAMGIGGALDFVVGKCKRARPYGCKTMALNGSSGCAWTLGGCGADTSYKTCLSFPLSFFKG